MLRLHLRENQSQTRSIIDMSRELSKAELLEIAREKIRAERYTAITAVKEQFARLKEAKTSAADEEGLEELPATSIFDLTRVVLDMSCRVTGRRIEQKLEYHF